MLILLLTLISRFNCLRYVNTAYAQNYLPVIIRTKYNWRSTEAFVGPCRIYVINLTNLLFCISSKKHLFILYSLLVIFQCRLGGRTSAHGESGAQLKEMKWLDTECVGIFSPPPQRKVCHKIEQTQRKNKKHGIYVIRSQYLLHESKDKIECHYINRVQWDRKTSIPKPVLNPQCIFSLTLSYSVYLSHKFFKKYLGCMCIQQNASPYPPLDNLIRLLKAEWFA